jgi:hypothetical protein
MQFMTGMADGPVPFHYPAPDYGEQLLVAWLTGRIQMVNDFGPGGAPPVARHRLHAAWLPETFGAGQLFLLRIIVNLPYALARPG